MNDSTTTSAFIYTLVNQGQGTQDATTQQITCMRYAAQNKLVVAATFFDTIPTSAVDGTAGGEEITAQMIGLRALSSANNESGGTVLMTESVTTTPLWTTIQSFFGKYSIPYTIVTRTPAGTAGGSW